MATYTPNYQLHQWKEEDHFLRSEFNQDFSRIDAAIQGVRTGAEGALSTAKSQLESAVSSVRTDLTGALNTAKIELAAETATKCEIYAGYYKGDGASSRLVRVAGGQPWAVMLGDCYGNDKTTGNIYAGLAVRGSSMGSTATGGTALSINTNGFTVYFNPEANVVTNMSGHTYHYMAFC